jgi:glycosyltransferase involved in cell wall biosynthesis
MQGMSFKSAEIKGLVSVVIPSYRGERFIRDSLNSVRHQTYSRWEILVVEDGSRDATQSIVEDFARRNPAHHVAYHRNEKNLGPSPARNVAFAQAQGEFVALLDADDRWLPDHLAGALCKLQSQSADVSFSSVVMIEDQSDLILGTWGPTANELSDFPHSLFFRNFVTPSATVMRRQVLAEVGPWDKQLRLCEDLDFWLRCVAAKMRFQYVGGCTCLYRRNHQEAATRESCALQEAFARVVERYIHLPGIRQDTCRRFASKAYLLAANCHAKSDPRWDASADRTRVPQLLFHAWRLRRKRVDHLLQSTALSAVYLFRRHGLRRLFSPIAETVPAAM